MDKIQAFVSEQIKENPPVVEIGSTVKVHNRIKEGARERIQIFEGTVIAKHGGGISETFTVVLHMDAVLKKLSPYILRMWRKLSLCVLVRFVVQSCTTFVSALARARKLKRKSITEFRVSIPKKIRNALRSVFFHKK